MCEGPRWEGTWHKGKGPVFLGCGEHRRRAALLQLLKQN